MGVENISDEPLDRITKEMKSTLKASDITFDAHCHVFTTDYIPDRYIKIKISMKDKCIKPIVNFLHLLNFKSDKDYFSRIANFLNVASSSTMDEIAEMLFHYYDEHKYFGSKTVLCPMMMDLQASNNSGIKGKINKPFAEQIEDMKSLVQRYPDRIIPFLAIDPTRPEIFEDIFVPAFESGLFFGIKLYPSLGYLPSHPALLNIYDICVTKQIPITVHCGTGSVRSSYHLFKEIPGLRYDENKPNEPAKMRVEKKIIFFKKNYANYFNDPSNWLPVLDEYPNLQLNLAHFGSTKEWEKYLKGKRNTWPIKIVDLISRFPNVYTDISYNIVEKSQHQALLTLLDQKPFLKERLLYGSDFFMTVKAGKFEKILTGFTESIGESLMKQISSENVRRFFRI